MQHAAKRKTHLPASLAAARCWLLLIVACCGLETRLWSFAAPPPTASGEIAFATPSFIGENYDAVAYDASDSLVAAKTGVGEGTKVFRVWGDEAGAYGRSWTTVDPRTVPNYRNAAGLPNQNSGRFVSEGVIQDATGIRFKAADPLHGNAGGLPEVVIPNPAQQIRLQNVQGLNPQF